MSLLKEKKKQQVIQVILNLKQNKHRHQQKTKNTHWQQTLCGVEDAEKVEDWVVDISRA